jgi:hypothetical protein
MAEFVITTDLAPIQNTVVEANFDEIIRAVQERVAPYKALVVTPETVRSAKNDLAELRRFEKQIDGYRKTIKEAFMAPVNAYAERVKPALEAIQSAVESINAQVKKFEDAETQKKIEEAAAYFQTEAKPDTLDYVSFEKLRSRHPEWKNKGATIEKVKSDIQTELAGIERDLTAIRAHDEKYRAVMLDAYKDSLRLTDALGKYASMKRTEELEKVRAEREAAARAAAEREAEERRQAAAKAREALENAEGTEIHAAPENDEINEAEPVQPEILVRDFRVWATREQLNGLGAWLKANGVRYGKVPKEGV